MPIYEFRCENAHEHERTVPISARDEHVDCPHCGSAARRRISAPRLSRLGTPGAKLLDATAATAHTPGVVDRVPGAARAGGARTTTDPRHARLPRP